MDTRKLVICLSLVAFATATVPVFRVAKSSSTHSNLQAAVDACPATGCRIELTDSVYTFTEPVSIRGKRDLQLVGIAIDGKRPVLRIDSSARECASIPSLGGYAPSRTYPFDWRKTTPETWKNVDGSISTRSYSVALGTVGTAPKFLLHAGRTMDGAEDPMRQPGWLVAPYELGQALDTSRSVDERFGWQHPALLQIEDAQDVEVTGFEFDGGAPLEYIISQIWSNRYDQFSSVAAVGLIRSLRATVRNCDFHDWGGGIRIVDDNPGGAVTDLIQADGRSWPEIVSPLSNPGRSGAHRIEDNLAHGNHLFLDLEFAWDLASSIRYNRAWENGSTWMVRTVDSSVLRKAEETWHVRRGGFAFFFDVVYPAVIFQGNTLVRNSLDLGMMNYRVSNAPIFVDGIVVRENSPGSLGYNPFEFLGALDGNLRNTWIASTHFARPYYRMLDRVFDSIVPFCSLQECEPLTPAWGASSVDSMSLGKGYFGEDLGAVWTKPREPELIRLQDQSFAFTTRSAKGWKVVLPVLLESSNAIIVESIRKAYAQKVVLSDIVDWTRSQVVLHPLPSLEGRSVKDGVNLLQFEIPASATDSIWRIEMTVEGLDVNTGRKVHSNIGTWLVRPLGKQLQVVVTDTGTVEPGQTVHFSVNVRDSLGQSASVERIPVLNADGWTLTASGNAGFASRKSGASTSFELQAVAPDREGVSQVVFWTSEPGRTTAIPGVAYVQVGARSTGLKPRSIDSKWSLKTVTKSGGSWNLALQGASDEEIAGARIRDLRGRNLSATPVLAGAGRGLRLVGAQAGTFFLTIGDRTVPLVLVP